MATVGSDEQHPIRVRVLGDFVVEGVDLRRIRSRKARTALKALALGRGRPVSVDHLIECLWGAGPAPAEPEREVAVNLSRVRGVLGRAAVVRADGGYHLAIDWLDLDVLDELAAEADRRLAAGDYAAARTAAAGALALVRGPLLGDEANGDWFALDRATVERTIAELRHVGAETALAVGELGQATALAERALALDPFDETSARMLMRAHAAAGRPGSALAVYAELRHRLVDELGAGPSAETDELHLAILVENDRPAATLPPRPGAGGDTPHASGEADQIDDTEDTLPGRRPVLERLRLARQHAADRVELVVIEGDAGVGKTRVADVFAAECRRDQVVVLVGRCDELGLALPLQPVADALSSALHGLDAVERSTLLGEDADVIAPLLGLGRTRRAAEVSRSGVLPAPAMTGEAMHTYVFAAVLRVLGRLGGPGAAVLVLDDVHLAGPSTLEWLRFCLRRGNEVPLLVVATRRAEEGAAIPATVHIPLEPLDLDAVRRVVGGDRADDLFLRSGGNPLLLVELAASDGEQLPASVRDAVGDRLARAGADVSMTIRTAAVLGPDVDLELLAAVLDRPPVAILDDLEEAVRRRFLEERGDRFEFRHALVRDALVADASVARQALVHRQAARALEGRAEVDALVLAHHARLGGERALAAAALARAGELATWRYDLGDAVAHLDAALALAPSAELHLARGKIRVARSDLDGAETDAEAAVRLGDRSGGLALRAWVARHRHDFDAAIRLGNEGAEGATDPDLRASCLLVVGLAERGLGHLPLADQRLEDARSVETRTDLGLGGWLGVLRVHQGRADEALALLEPALGAEVDVVHGFWVEHVLQMAAHAHGMRGEPDLALDRLDRLTTEMHRRGSETRYRGLDDNYRAWILRNLGAPEAAELNERALEHGSMPEIMAQAALDLAAATYLQGRLDDAAGLLAEASDRTARNWFTNRWRCEERAALLEALVAIADGRPADAEAGGAALTAESGDRGDARYEVLGRLMVARARQHQGGPVDRSTVADLLGRLPAVAGMEAWWLTAETAADFDEPKWWALADHRVAALATRAGGRAPGYLAHAERRFGGLGR